MLKKFIISDSLNITTISDFPTSLKPHDHRLIKLAIPFEKSTVSSPYLLAFVSDQGDILEFGAVVTARWPDNSIKWITVELCAYKLEYSVEAIDLYRLNEPSFSGTSIDLRETDHELLVQSPYNKIKLERHKNKVTSVEVDNLTFIPQITIDDANISVDFENWEIDRINKDYGGSERKIVTLKSKISIADKHIDCVVQLTVRAYSPQIDVKIKILNGNPASHPGGLWDLGDEGSVYFDRFCIDLKPVNKSNFELNLTNQTFSNCEQIDLVQYSSGGEKWDSTNHVNSRGEVPLKIKGYRGEVDRELVFGNRYEPKLAIIDEQQNSRLSIAPYAFWENFPTGVRLDGEELSLAFLAKVDYQHELQGGEGKTFQFSISCAANAACDDCYEPVTASVSPTYLGKTNAFYLLNENVTKGDENEELINTGISGENNFFAKREVVDEYGWRNFGDLFADHETLGEKGKSVKVSHYNNQYDPLYGFLRQYLISGNKNWLTLANDLATHIKDIDIYKTNKDRDEYNHGLFWHTDHYLDAKTCTHRTFSKHHEHAYDGYTPGGGPGGQHCYSTGLAYHYILTGDLSSKQAVIDMAKWISLLYDGSPTVLAKLFAIKNSWNHGTKNLITEEYPLDRGTGNMVIAQLDAYLVTEDASYLERAGSILMQTIHFTDDIASRNFEDIESTWFYTVLLQSVVRFLTVKLELNEYDQTFETIRRSFIHYASWMLHNEAPYLSNSEKLEFPNTTWAAQDIRKAYLFAAASFFEPEQSEEFKAKSQFFYDYVENEITKCETRSVTRILALLMQNHGAKQFFLGRVGEFPKVPVSEVRPSLPNKYIKIIKIISTELRRFSLRRELRWLSFRSQKVAELVGNYVR